MMSRLFKMSTTRERLADLKHVAAGCCSTTFLSAVVDLEGFPKSMQITGLTSAAVQQKQPTNYPVVWI